MHGRIENSSALKAKLYHGPSKTNSTFNMRTWFPWIVAALIHVIVPVSSYYIYQSAKNGVIFWEPYPLFAFFVFLVFMANTRIYRDR